VISGPEPQRSIFEQQLLQQMEKIDLKCTLIRGLLNNKNTVTSTKVTVIDHLPSNQLAQQMEQSEFIICRSGYSTIMDLHAIGRSAILVPTPGQSEQEYLAELHSNLMITSQQNKFDLERLTQSRTEQIHNKNIEPLAKSLPENAVLTVQPD